MRYAIEASQLTKSYSQRHGLAGLLRRRPPLIAIDRIDLTVAPGQVFGLLGLNGAGKTTLVRILCGLMLPTEGVAVVLGHDISREGGRIRARVGLASGEERSFSWRLSARRNLLFFAELHGMRGAAARALVADLLEMLGLAAAADRPVGGFSSGMRQKLAIARALLHAPPLLFLDEPTRGLDLHASDELLALLGQELVGRRGTTVFLTTHRMEEAERLCENVAILHGGRIRAAGHPADLRAALGLTTRYTVGLDGPPALPDSLRAELPDLALGDDGVSHTISFSDRDGALDRILSYLTASGRTIRSIETRPPSLADVFRHYTGADAPSERSDGIRERDIFDTHLVGS
jgi:ABC-2 type transport system ATP-binding protein